METDGPRGFDAAAGEYTDLLKRGIMDPTKAVRIALQNGASIANMLLSTDAVVSELPEPKEKTAQPPMPEY